MSTIAAAGSDCFCTRPKGVPKDVWTRGLAADRALESSAQLLNSPFLPDPYCFHCLGTGSTVPKSNCQAHATRIAQLRALAAASLELNIRASRDAGTLLPRKDVGRGADREGRLRALEQRRGDLLKERLLAQLGLLAWEYEIGFYMGAGMTLKLFMVVIVMIVWLPSGILGACYRAVLAVVVAALVWSEVRMCMMCLAWFRTVALGRRLFRGEIREQDSGYFDGWAWDWVQIEAPTRVFRGTV